jgi:hypothetical protein
MWKSTGRTDASISENPKAFIMDTHSRILAKGTVTQFSEGGSSGELLPSVRLQGKEGISESGA